MKHLYLTDADLHNIISFMDRVSIQGIKEVHVMNDLLTKINDAILDQEIPPPPPSSEEAESQIVRI